MKPEIYIAEDMLLRRLTSHLSISMLFSKGSARVGLGDLEVSRLRTG